MGEPLSCSSIFRAVLTMFTPHPRDGPLSSHVFRPITRRLPTLITHLCCRGCIYLHEALLSHYLLEHETDPARHAYILNHSLRAPWHHLSSVHVCRV